MKFIHAGDLHVWRKSIPLSDPFSPKRWLGSTNLILKRARKFPPDYRDLMFAAIQQEQPEVLIFTGDFSQASQQKEFEECARLFEPLREALGERLIAIPGNHDVYTHGAVRDRLLEEALPWVHMDPVKRIDLDGDLTVVTVNHSQPFHFRSNGLVLPATQEKLCKTLTRCQEEERKVILSGHYPYATPPEHPETPHHQLLGEELFAEMVREYAPQIYLHGHNHVRWAITPKITPETICLNCGSLGMKSDSPEKQAGFLSFDITPEGTLEGLTAHVYSGHGRLQKHGLDVRNLSV